MSDEEFSFIPTQDLFETSQSQNKEKKKFKDNDKVNDHHGEGLRMREKVRTFEGKVPTDQLTITLPSLPSLSCQPSKSSQKLPKKEISDNTLAKVDISSILIKVADLGLPDEQRTFLEEGINDPEYKKALYIFGRSGLDLNYFLCHYLLYEISRRMSKLKPGTSFLSLCSPFSSRWPLEPLCIEDAMTVLRRPTPLRKCGQYSLNAPFHKPLWSHFRNLTREGKGGKKVNRRIPAFIDSSVASIEENFDGTEDIPRCGHVELNDNIEFQLILEEVVDKIWPQVLAKWKCAILQQSEANAYEEPIIDQHLRRIVAKKVLFHLNDLINVLFDSMRDVNHVKMKVGLTHGSLVRLSRFTSIPPEVIERMLLKVKRVFPLFHSTQYAVKVPLITKDLIHRSFFVKEESRKLARFKRKMEEEKCLYEVERRKRIRQLTTEKYAPVLGKKSMKVSPITKEFVEQVRREIPEMVASQQDDPKSNVMIFTPIQIDNSTSQNWRITTLSEATDCKGDENRLVVAGLYCEGGALKEKKIINSKTVHITVIKP